MASERDHKQALSGLRAELVERLREARDGIRWSSGYVNPEYRRVGFEHARRLVGQLRALDAAVSAFVDGRRGRG